MNRRLLPPALLLAAWLAAAWLAADAPTGKPGWAEVPHRCGGSARACPPRWYYLWIDFREWMTT